MPGDNWLSDTKPGPGLSLRDLTQGPGLSSPPPRVRYFIVKWEHLRWTSNRPWVVIEAIEGSISATWQFTSFGLATEWVGVCLDEGSAAFRKALKRWASGLGWGPLLAVSGERGDPFIRRLIEAGVITNPMVQFDSHREPNPLCLAVGEMGRR